MNAAYNAVLVATQTALELLGETLAELPDGALDWTPAEGANSVAVLVQHCCTATLFLASTGAGLAPDRQRYLEGDRAQSFKTRGATVRGLRDEVASLGAKLPPILEAGKEETLSSPAPWAWPDGRTPACGEILVHSLGHLKEHVGQVQLMRDLWLASHRAGK